MNDTLDFPEIVEPTTAIAPAKADLALPDLTKLDLTAVALAQYGDWRKGVAATRANLSTLALDLSTPSKIKEARTLRQRLIGEPLAAMRKLSAGIKSKMAATSKALGAELELIEAAYAEADTLILPQIEAREAELEREREEARRIEDARKEKHRTNLEAIRIYVERASAPGMTSERIARGIEQLQAIPTPTTEAWEEFAVPAADAICQTLDKMRALHTAAIEREAENARQEAQRVENARVAAELAENQRKLNEQREELARQQRLIDEADERARRRERDEFIAANPVKELTQTLEPNCHAPESSVAPPAKAADVIPDTPAAPGGDQGLVEITQDAQESGSLPGTPGACASTGAEAAEAPGSGDEGKAAHADECAADTRPAINVGEINRRLGFTVTSAFVKDTLGITPEGFSKGGTAIWSARAWPLICAALVAHVQEKAGE